MFSGDPKLRTKPTGGLAVGLTSTLLLWCRNRGLLGSDLLTVIRVVPPWLCLIPSAVRTPMPKSAKGELGEVVTVVLLVMGPWFSLPNVGLLDRTRRPRKEEALRPPWPLRRLKSLLLGGVSGAFGTG